MNDSFLTPFPDFNATSVADPNLLFSDPDRDPILRVIAEPDPVPSWRVILDSDSDPGLILQAISDPNPSRIYVRIQQ